MVISGQDVATQFKKSGLMDSGIHIQVVLWVSLMDQQGEWNSDLVLIIVGLLIVRSLMIVDVLDSLHARDSSKHITVVRWQVNASIFELVSDPVKISIKFILTLVLRVLLHRPLLGRRIQLECIDGERIFEADWEGFSLVREVDEHIFLLLFD